MITAFWKDLKQGKRGEEIVYNHLREKNPECKIEYLGENKEYYHIGDIKLTTPQGNIFYFEVKNDTRIADTHNILCEEQVYYYDNKATCKGFIYSNYTNYCIVSERERKIYLFDFNIIKKIYKMGYEKVMKYAEQESITYLLPIEIVKAFGGLITVANY